MPEDGCLDSVFDGEQPVDLSEVLLDGSLGEVQLGRDLGADTFRASSDHSPGAVLLRPFGLIIAGQETPP